MATSVSAVWSSVILSLSARQGKFGQYNKSKYIGISKKIIIIIKLRWDLFVTNTIIQSITSTEMCSLHLTHPSAHTWSSGQSGEQLGVRCLAQASHLSRGQFLPEPRFEPTTSGYKSNARPQLPPKHRLSAKMSWKISAKIQYRASLDISIILPPILLINIM